MSDKKTGYKQSRFKQSRTKSGKKSEKKKDKSEKTSEKTPPAEPRPRATAMTATEVVPNLFVGTRDDAEAIGERVPDDWVCISVTEFRSRYGRKEELPYEPVGSLDMPFMADGPDGWHADPYKLDLIAETIWWRLLSGKKVLVHCIHAQERGPLAIAWYLAWSGTAPSLQSAYEMVIARHPRTERRDAWLRTAAPSQRSPELAALLGAARAFGAQGSEGSVQRADALTALETAAIAWTTPLQLR